MKLISEILNLNEIFQNEQIPRPCCAPTKLDELVMIYHDDHRRVIMRKHPHMIVRSCGCH